MSAFSKVQMSAWTVVRGSSRSCASTMRTYADFGPTLAAEKLQMRHAITIAKETVRQMQIASGLPSQEASQASIGVICGSPFCIARW